MNIRNMEIGTNFLAVNKYGQMLHFKLVGKPMLDDGRVFFRLQRMDTSGGIPNIYSESDMLEYKPA